MYPCDHSVCITSMISWTADEGMLSPSQFFHPCLSSPCRLQNPRGELHSRVLMSWPGFWWKNKDITVSYFYREHMVCIYFVIGFYHLVERCYCIWSERSLSPSFHRSWLFFHMGDGFRGHVDKTAMEIFPLLEADFCLFIWNLTFLPMVRVSCSK